MSTKTKGSKAARRREARVFPIGGNLLGRVEPDSTDFDFGDVLDGVPEIANFIFPQTNTRKARRRTYHLCEKGKIPAYKLAGKWNARKARLREHFAQLEANGDNA